MERINDNLNLNDNLNADKFKLVFKELKAMEVLCRSAPIPGVSANSIPFSTPHSNFHMAGSKVNYDNLDISFGLDKNLVAYQQIFNWFTAIHSPVSSDQYKTFVEKNTILTPGSSIAVDASLYSLTNSLNPNIEIRFHNLFPISLSSVDFANEGSSNNNLTINASFQYDYFTIENRLTQGRNNIA